MTVGNTEEKGHLGGLGVGVRITLMLILKTRALKM
jgi:hypothetical protein